METKMREEIEKLKAEVDAHLAKAHDGTAIHTILKTLSTLLTGPEDREDPVGPTGPAIDKVEV
jgi:hypothetical protein